MRASSSRARWIGLAACAAAACGGTGGAGLPGGTGGTSATGGMPGTAGRTSSGGTLGSGGSSATGGALGSGGVPATGGAGGAGAGRSTGGHSGGQGMGGLATGGAGTGGMGTGGLGAGGSVSAAVSVVTNRYDNSRNGANTRETILTVANVGGGKFGLLFSRMLDGHVYAQPLYVPGLTINGAKHNVVFVATENNTLSAYDADDPSASTPLWTKSLGTPMRTYPGTENTVPSPPNTVSCRDMYPQTGVTSTPVIDPATGRIYVVSKNFENNVYSQRLHALDLLTGQELLGGPVTISGSVPGRALDGNGTTVTFSPYHHLNRPGLLLQGGNVFVAFASHCDDEPYHGWIFAYAADTLAQKATYCTTPDGGGTDPISGGPGSGTGGIWQSGMGLVGNGTDIYFASGNGAYDATNMGAQLGISVGRLQLTSSGLKVLDWFTPYNADAMNDNDLDYTTAPVLLPNPAVIVMGGKDGFLNVLDPMNLGKYRAGSTQSANQVIQQVSVGGHSHGGPVYWNGPAGPTIYVWPEKQSLRAYHFNGNKLATPPASQYAGDSATHPGGTLSLSANGASAGTAILWATFSSSQVDTKSGHAGDAWHYIVPGALYAFDASNLVMPIWTSIANKARDDLGNLAKFNPPTVANGKVYVASQVAPMSDSSSTAAGKLQVYGLLP